jgi:hypothetical protein
MPPKPAPPPVPRKIEDRLKGVGFGFWMCGLIGATACAAIGCFALIGNYPGTSLSMLLAAVGSLSQGIIIRVLFDAAAEAIILLRKIADNK